MYFLQTRCPEYGWTTASSLYLKRRSQEAGKHLIVRLELSLSPSIRASGPCTFALSVVSLCLRQPFGFIAGTLRWESVLKSTFKSSIACVQLIMFLMLCVVWSVYHIHESYNSMRTFLLCVVVVSWECRRVHWLLAECWPLGWSRCTTSSCCKWRELCVQRRQIKLPGKMSLLKAEYILYIKNWPSNNIAKSVFVFVSQLWHELCDLISQNPDKVTSLNVGAIIRGGLTRFTDQLGKLWCSLADYYIRSGHFEKVTVLLSFLCLAFLAVTTPEYAPTS